MTKQSGLPLLIEVMRESSADRRPLYALNRLRFALEVRTSSPNLEDEINAYRGRLTELLQNDGFDLELLLGPFGADRALFLTFAPSGIERTLPEDVLYSIAADLRSALDLVSCEPDIGAAAYIEPRETTPLGPEGIVLDDTCWVQGKAPTKITWALDNMRVPQAWILAPEKGMDVVIAQPDTGIVEHAELVGATIALSKSLNLLEGGTDPLDPLSSRMSNPGHGTSTASVVASSERGRLIGSAPNATLVPIRCTDDVKIFDATPLTRAVTHAIRIGAHVVTISLGGIWSRSLHAAIRQAVGEDIIVLAAAGNCVGLVVWPAAYDEVIAIGGTNIRDRKWLGSSFGPAVDVSAPAEFVWRAERQRPTSPDDIISAGQGTSFATALAAGVAALWLSRHSRAAALAEARRRGTVVQELFRAALQTTARVPPNFPTGLGSGIIDAEALLTLPLDRIPPYSPLRAAFGSADPSGGLSEALASVIGPGVADTSFDWAAFGAEASALLIADARAGRRATGPAVEARAFRRASRALTDAAAGARDSRIAHIALRAHLPAPSLIIRKPTDTARLARMLSTIGGTASPELAPEGKAQVSPETGRRLLDEAGRRKIIGSLEGRSEGVGSPLAGTDIAHLDRALRSLHASGAAASLDEAGAILLEALVSLSDRPAVPVTLRTTPDNRVVQTIDTSAPELGRFAALVELARPLLESSALPPDPAKISTSHVERQNLNMRVGMRRFTRLTNGFSKKVESHAAMVALYTLFYNFCRVHKTLRVTPAMAAGLTDHIWDMEEVVGHIDVLAPKPGPRGPYRKRA